MLEKIETLPEKVPKEGIGSSFSPGKRKKKKKKKLETLFFATKQECLVRLR